jgi:hypothetical protein
MRISSSVTCAAVGRGQPAAGAARRVVALSSHTNGKASTRQPAHRQGDDPGDAAPGGQRQPLGHQFAEDQREEGDQADREPVPMVPAYLPTAGRCLAHPDGDAAPMASPPNMPVSMPITGDADLHGGQEALGLLGQRQRLARAALAVLGHLLQPRSCARS